MLHRYYICFISGGFISALVTNAIVRDMIERGISDHWSPVILLFAGILIVTIIPSIVKELTDRGF